jgi:hypothetical protein
MLGTSINLINWNARGLGRVKEQKVQDLLGLMNENDVQIAIVSETRESAGRLKPKPKPMVILFIKTRTMTFRTHHNICLPKKWFGVSA